MGVESQGVKMQSKVVAFLFIAAMVVQVIKPLGLPGLKKRGDFWKIAVAAIAVMMLTVFIRPS
jgi:hypothetical protein